MRSGGSPLLTPEAFQMSVGRAVGHATFATEMMKIRKIRDVTWTAEDLLLIASNLRLALDNIGLALNHQRAIERRAKRTTK